MKTILGAENGGLTLRILLSLSLCCAGGLLAVASLSGGRVTPSANGSGGVRIYVTSLAQKVKGVGSGGCSLQEAIYSSTLHQTFGDKDQNGNPLGIAIDLTNPDEFITTECIMGTGNGDTIVLPTGGVFNLTDDLVTDAYNPYGPTATPIIFSKMTIEGNGARLEWKGNGNARLFAVGPAQITIKAKSINTTVSGIGDVTLQNAHVKGFRVKGGKGGNGAGGGIGAGGAIYLQSALTVQNCTFESNSATGGDGGLTYGDNSGKRGGGGGGMAGNGGNSSLSAGGGGGARGNGGNGADLDSGGGGGGTVLPGAAATSSDTGGAGGALCGGKGGDGGSDGGNAPCAGGGGGGGAAHNGVVAYDGGSGNYGGGGGGGEDNCGSGGFGGGGGGDCTHGGAGGYGGGGGHGYDSDGSGEPFGGFGGGPGGGGGAGLGGAIFNDSGTVTIQNSTFTKNAASGGKGYGNPIAGGAGGAIFSTNGSLTIANTTIAANTSSYVGGAITVSGDISTAGLTLNDTIMANNGDDECELLNVSTSGAGNLIMKNGAAPFTPCPGVATTTDPQLGPLGPASQNGGNTPTMTIPLYSSAMGTADQATSLATDQRAAPRPQADISPRNGYDIGAYELCRRRKVGGGVEAYFCSYTTGTIPETTLTMQASPGSDGTTSPAPGGNTVDQNSVYPIQASPVSGYSFGDWTSDTPGSVADPNSASTTVRMGTQPVTVTANFVMATPTPTPTATPEPSPTATASPTPTSSQSPTATPTPTPDSSASPSATATATPNPTATPATTPAASLLNISTRMEVLTGSNVLIGGFIVTGSDQKKVLIRGLGPSLPVSNDLADPTLELHDGSGATLFANDNWKETQQGDIEGTKIPPPNDLESAIVATLPADNSAYTAILAGNSGTGVGLVEVYDIAADANSQLANISTRGFVDTGDNVMIGGFILGPDGSGSATVLVRAIGPSLAGAGVSGVLGDPMLELHDGSGAMVANNDNWKDSQQADIEATTIPPTNDLESAIVQTLTPGNYTAVVRGNNSTTGVALVEVYNLQ